jgi:hypothetical protein
MPKFSAARVICAALLTLVLAVPASADPIKFARYPHVSQAGSPFPITATSGSRTSTARTRCG